MFIVGQKVVCISDDHPRLCKGATYIIRNVSEGWSGLLVRLQGKGLEDFYASRFSHLRNKRKLPEWF